MIEKGAKIERDLPNMEDWKAGFESEIRAATNEVDINAVWESHEDMIENLTPTDRAEVERIYRECLEKVQ